MKECSNNSCDNKHDNKSYCSRECYIEGRDISGENNPMYGRDHDEETIEKISESKKGHEPWNKREIPDGFESDFNDLKLRELEKKYNARRKVIYRWARELDLEISDNLKGENNGMFNAVPHNKLSEEEAEKVGHHNTWKWKEQRKRALERDGFQCVKCGRSKEENRELYGRDLEVDHIIPYRLSQSHDLENLQTLCSECHMVKTNSNEIRKKVMDDE